MTRFQGTVDFFRPLPGYSNGILQNRCCRGSKVWWKHSLASDQVDEENTERRTVSFKKLLSKACCGAKRGDISTLEISRDCSDPSSSFESTENNRELQEEMDRSSDDLPASPSFSSDVSQQVDGWPKPVNLGSPRDVGDGNVNVFCTGDYSSNGMIKASTQVFLRVVPPRVIRDRDMGGEHCPLQSVDVSTANTVKVRFYQGSMERRRLELERKRKFLEGRISAIRANYSSSGIGSSDSSHGSTCNSSNSDSSDNALTRGDKIYQLGMSGGAKVPNCRDHGRKSVSLKFVDHVPTHSIENAHPGCRPRPRPEYNSVWKLEVSSKVPFYYSGIVAHGCLPHGRGFMKFANGDSYVGTFKHGQMHGSKGVYVWSNGSVYTGDFVNNMPHGHGDYRMKDERRYMGNFESGMLNGYGEAYSKDGTLYHKGQWENGIPDHKYVPFILDEKDDQSSRMSIPVACDTSATSTDDPSESIYESPSAVGRHDRCLSRYARPVFSHDNEGNSMLSKPCTSLHSDSSSTSEQTCNCSDGSVVISRTVSIHLAVRRLRKRIDMLEQERRIQAEQELAQVD